MLHLLLPLVLWCLPLAVQPHPAQPAVTIPTAFDCFQVPGDGHSAPLPRIEDRGFVEGPLLA
jgi:hypothetical protein